MRPHFLLAFFCLFVVYTSVAAAEPCKPGYRTVTLSSQDTGAVVYGPVCVSVPVNGLRYNAFLGFQITVTPVDLTPGLAAPGAAGPDPSSPPDVLLKNAANWIENMKSDLDAKTKADDSATTNVNNAVADITTLVSISDAIYQQPNGTTALFQRLDPKSDFRQELNTANGTDFKTMENAVTLLTNMQNLLQKVQLDNPAIQDPLKTLLSTELTDVSAMLTTASAYLPNGANSVAYRKQRQIFLFWYDRITKLTMADFFVQRNVPCHTIGNETKTIGVVLNRTDLSPILSGAVPTTVTATSPLVTINCPSAFSISGGLAISFVPTQNIGLIPAATSGTYTFGVTKTTNQSVMPIAMVHARLYSYRSFALQAGFGVAVHTQDDSAGGTGAEYLLGLGVSLFRTIYITPGWQSGRTTALSPGYSLGGTVPSGVTAAPLVNGYSPGFGLALTFTKP
jgi:hypothetical protein